MNKKTKQKNIDLGPRKSVCVAKNVLQMKPVLFSRGKKSNAFFTEDSKLYITPREYELLRRGIRLDRSIGKWDCLSSRIVRDFKSHSPSASSKLLEVFEKRYQSLQESAAQASQNIFGQLSLVRLWNISIVGAILLGMVTMTFVYRYLGQGASARELRDVATQEQVISDGTLGSPKVLGSETSKDQNTAVQTKTDDKKKLEKQIKEMLKGYPMESMAPYIANYNRTVAAFIVAIGKKESGWGEHHPSLDGEDCYNYWGFRQQRQLMGTGGHTCFNSPKDAVDTVAKRIDFLVSNEGRDTGSKMVTVWKCGGDCEATGGQAAADKWASDVDMYLDKFKTD
jgi:hypothetical protein